ncbi:MAG: nucleotidyl transferase AbiEii/AbiGii toxin family protein [Propionibacteriaceae bacterium]|nr:nucleotidyl transferase AbiEii/AbiGii toxin family protein [Propionibacteriaceae bacterium]
MSPTPTRDTSAGRAHNDLRNLARRDRRDVAEYLALYTLEGFLDRLTRSPHADDLVLKGGVLLAAFSARRPTRDIDLRATGFADDIAAVETIVGSIAAIPADDGLVFDPGSVHAETIRDEADYQGVRVQLTAQLASAVIAFHVDVNFGDPIWPAPVTVSLPRLLGGTVDLRGYPAHMALAEKIVTAIERGTANTRWRDFVDIVGIAATTPINADDLATAMATVADHRAASLVPLVDVLAGMATVAQPKWAAWRRKQRLNDTTPERFQDLVDACVAFADPVLTGQTVGKTWSPTERAWVTLERQS